MFTLGRAPTLNTVISGGQTGADQAALHAAEAVGFATGGYAPAGFMTVDGPARALLGARFGLRQLADHDYPARSRKNVDCSDATVAFRTRPTTGTDTTIGYCRTGRWARSFPPRAGGGRRPCLVVTRDTEDAAGAIARFVRAHAVCTLNVCGHRSDARAGFPGYTDWVHDVMVDALDACK